MAVKLVVRHPGTPPGGQDEVSFEFEQARVVLGRSPGADVRLPGLTVSELHATLELSGGGVRLRDEGSTNGTRVNGVSLVPSRPRSLSSGDEVEIGEFHIRVLSGPLLGSATSPERTASLARRLLKELAGPGSEAAAPPFLRVTAGPDRDTVLHLADPPSRLVIGRAEDAGLVLRDPDVSREHIEIVRDLDGSLARDLASKNGLEVNGRRMRERRLRDGDTLRLGETLIAYHDPAEQGLKRLEGQPDRTLAQDRAEPPSTPLVSAEPAAEQGPAEAAAAAPQAASGTSAPTSQVDGGSTQGTELLIYGLAGLILLASLVGLIWLFK
jgi:pSer/pThr/pTyr-binding forkhead associated (FHA) protein